MLETPSSTEEKKPWLTQISCFDVNTNNVNLAGHDVIKINVGFKHPLAELGPSSYIRNVCLKIRI